VDSARRAAGCALAEFGLPALFLAGTATAVSGSWSPWFVLPAVLASLVLRKADLDAQTLNVPGGLYGSVRAALGEVPARMAVSALLVERLVLGTLAAALGGQYLMAFARLALGGSPWLTLETAPFGVAAPAIAAAWILQRQRRGARESTKASVMNFAVLVFVALVAWATAAAAFSARSSIPWLWSGFSWSPAAGGMLRRFPGVVPAIALFLVALGHTLPALGSTDALGASTVGAGEPRAQGLRAVAAFVGAFGLLVTAGGTFLYVALVPLSERAEWANAPLAGLTAALASQRALRLVALSIVTAAVGAFLWTSLGSAWKGAIGLVSRLTDEGVLALDWRAQHHRFGTPWRTIDAVGLVQVGMLLVSGGQVEWLAGTYGVAIACAAVFRASSVVRLRLAHPEPSSPSRGARLWSAAYAAVALIAGSTVVALVLALDGPALAAVLLIATLSVALAVSERRVAVGGRRRPVLDRFHLLSSPDVDLRYIDIRPGAFLVPVRNPHGLVHLAAALRAAGDHDVVAMTVRLVGVDGAGDTAGTTDEERALLSSVIAVAEREQRAVRLLIVPGFDVIESVIDTALRLQASEVHVGESVTLSADDQARLTGLAWERAERPSTAALRLVVHHPRGGAEAYQLGVHPPALQSGDYELIHRLWLDIVRTVGPHVHHRDVVRAALTHMEHDLNGPIRDAVLQTVRETARPADAVAAIIRERDFGHLRDVLRNRPASDLASVLAGLSLDERVLVFRILPREEAAATFGYLSSDEQEALLRAMASEEAAALLNAMPPDDRTTLLEELPAEATRQLLSLLTPEERAEAVRLLGYPEHSIGRLMTSHYVAVREHWTVQEVLDHVRTHGEDSETLNMLYVVNDRGVLIDDVRIREFLLKPPTHTVSQLMDRRFVALKAADDQETAVSVFRAEDRTALPVTDSAGVLIGIVTVDDVLDVAEQEATEDIQRLGGSEALDEPYMKIQFARMIQKRAGWLTALFLGEMLTATAMGAFEREIERAVVLALFVPLIISSGGNSGSQASTLVIRALALGEVTLRDWWSVMRREFAAGLALGGILGSIGFLRITVWSAFSTIYGPHWFLVATTVALALVGIVLWGTLVGSLLPFGLRRLGFDPAASSAPFVATLVDVTGLVIYFSVGMVVLRGTLL
jgi:magnesium transporter